MQRTLIIYTGGTLGMRSSASGYIPDAELERPLAELLCRAGAGIPEYDFHTFEPLLDSANMQPDDWYRIGTCIRDHYERYSGFVVLHGTDTMAYTASALSFALQGLNKPVLVTGSQIPLRETRSDAHNNLVASLLLSADDALAEVCLYFNGKLLRGNRASKISSGSLDAFASPNYPLLGKVGIHVDIERSALLPSPVGRNFQIPEFADGGVVLLKLFPGISSFFLGKILEYRPKGLVLETYGTGNAPSDDFAFTGLLKNASEQGVICVAVSQCLHNRVDLGKYSAGSALRDAKVIGGLDMTPEAAYTKLNHLLAMDISQSGVRELMQTALCGECTL